MNSKTTRSVSKADVRSYYELLAREREKIVAFPPGFQMISGDSQRRSLSLPVPDPEKSNWQLRDKTQDALSQKDLGCNCLGSKESEPSLARHFMPTKSFLDANCPDGIRMELMFPSGWDREHLDSPNHKDHVAFSDLVLDGRCPQGFESRLPSMHYEVVWNTSAFRDSNGTFVLANGDTTGYSYHGDFMNGWDTETLRQAIDSCTSSSGRIGNCPVFAVQSDMRVFECNFPPPAALENEDCRGPRHNLPGDISLRRCVRWTRRHIVRSV